MSTSLPMLMPSQTTAGGENASLPVNTEVGDSSQAFANVLGSHFQPEGMTSDMAMVPLTTLENSTLMPLMSATAVDGQNLPLDLSQSAMPDGNALPLSPELMWSGMLIVNDPDAVGPQLYQLSEDGQTLTAQIDPNMRAQLNRAMNRFAPVTNTEMPELLNVTGHLAANQTPGLNEQSMLFAATAKSPGFDAVMTQKFSEALPVSLLNADSDALSALSTIDQGSGTQGVQSLGLASLNERGAERFPELAQLQMSGSPKNPAWAQGIGERVQWLVQQNIQGAEIRLNPPELGLLEVKVQLNGDQAAQIQFSSPNGTVREALEAAIPRLREMFAETGLSLGDVNVSHQSFAEQGQNGDGEGNTEGRSSSELVANESIVLDENAAQTRLVSDGLVDMYV